MLKAVKFIYHHRRILKATTSTDIKARYAGANFGFLWLILYPLLFLGAYALIYVYVFNIRFQMFDTKDYVLLIFCGLIPFLGFSEAVSLGTTSVSSNMRLLKNTMFPIELLPVKTVLVSQFIQLVNMGILFTLLLIYGKITIFTLLLPVIWFFQILFLVGFAWIISALNVFFRDFQNVIPIFILLIMMVSPIAYPIEMVPTNLKPLLGINPMFYYIVSFQDVLMIGRMPQLHILAIMAFFSTAIFFIGYEFFSRVKGVFSDYE